MAATANPLKIRNQSGPASTGSVPADAPPAPPAAALLQEVLTPEPAQPPPLPAAPPPAEGRYVPRPQAAASKPPPRDLGLLGRIFVWGLVLVLVGGTTVGWVFGVNMVGSFFGQFAEGLGGGEGLQMEGMPPNIMAGFAEAMGSSMGKVTFPGGAPDMDLPEAATPEPVEPAPKRNLLGMVKKPAPDAAWPDMQLNGVLIGSEDWKGSVILDSEMVPLNESLHGVKLVAVETYGAWFEYEGARKFVEIHGRTR